jgi:hypothetical protein
MGQGDPIDRDLGNRDAVEASLLPVADDLDRRAAEVEEAIALTKRAAFAAKEAKSYETAALLFEQCACAYVKAFGPSHHRALDFACRASACSSLAAIQRRGKK